MKSVLISINPKWCELIASGKKTIEVRKTRPNIETPFKCYIYQTMMVYNSVSKKNDGLRPHLVPGKVIGVFVCDKIYDIEPHYDTPNFCNQYVCGWNAGDDDDCLSFSDLNAYLCGKHGYGWHISDLKIYEKPKELSEFRRHCKNIDLLCFCCDRAITHDDGYVSCNSKISRPPQSYMFVEELQDV